MKINIQLKVIDAHRTQVVIEYQYTGLNEEQNQFVEAELENFFKESRKWWEKAINHYLLTGEMLRKK